MHFQAICPGRESTSLNRAKHGLRILDRGFQNTAVMESAVTFVDGVEGTIRYRQHSIDNLFGHYGFEEVSYLLIWGQLPTCEEKIRFRGALNSELEPPAVVVDAINVFPHDGPVFAMVIAGLAAYAANDPSSVPSTADNPNLYQGDMVFVDRALIKTISSMAAIIALIYCRQQGRELTPPDPDLPFISNVPLMMGFVEEESKRPSPKVVEYLERLWVLYCDHEMTNSTAAFLHVASTLADPMSCCTAYVASANGPLHGGAIDLAYKAFRRLGTPDNVPGMIADVKAKRYRLSGYGNRIYKTVDPRAKFIRTMLGELSEEIDDNTLLAITLKIDKIASKDSYFTIRNLKANADLYGCFVYTAL